MGIGRTNTKQNVSFELRALLVGALPTEVDS